MKKTVLLYLLFVIAMVSFSCRNPESKKLDIDPDTNQRIVEPDLTKTEKSVVDTNVIMESDKGIHEK